MHLVHVPNPTGSGHAMRTLAVADQLRLLLPEARQTVLLAAMQDVFTPLFTERGIEVVDLHPGTVTNTATRQHLPDRLDWDGMVAGYLVPTFLSSDRMLRLLVHYRRLGADLVVSDYNPAASLAAAAAGLPHVLVTERYTFSLLNAGNEQLTAGGFEVADGELDDARQALREVFALITASCAAVLTDKPPLPELPRDQDFLALQAEGKAHFVGPMIRPLPDAAAPDAGDQARAALGLGPGRIVLALLGGTTMRLANRHALARLYLDTFTRLREKHDDLELVIIGRGSLAEAGPLPAGVRWVDYIPDWRPLLRESALVFVQPGWVSVTEVCAYRVPAVFLLSSLSEYHEIESFERLQSLGLPSQLGTDPDELTTTAEELLTSPAAVAELRERQRVVAPDAHGARRAAELIAAVSGRVPT